MHANSFANYDEGVVDFVAIDITERKRAEEKLRESEELFARVFHINPGLLAVSRPKDGAHFDVNRTWIETMGYSREEAMAHSAVELGIWADSAERQRFVARLENEGRVRNFEAKFRTKGGEELDVLVAGAYMEIHGGPRLLVVSHDITDRKRAEEALRDSDARLRDAIESISEGFILYDADERFVLCNSRYRDFYPSIADMLKPGARLEDVARTAFETGAIQGLTENVEEWMERRLTQYHTGERTHEQRLKDGRWLLCSERKTPGGGIVGIRTDITERKLSEIALRERENQLRLITDGLPVLITSVDRAHNYLFANKTCQDWYARPTVEIIGRTVKEFVGDTVYERLRPRLGKALAGETLEFSERIAYPDGQTRDVHVAYVPHFTPDHKVDSIYVMTVDITGRKQAELALQTSEANLAKAQRVAQCGHWVWNESRNKISSYSDELLRILGVTPETFPMDFEAYLVLVHPEDRRRYASVVAEAGARSTGYEIQFRLVRPDGELRHLTESVEVAFDERGRFAWSVGVIQDVTERKRISEELEKSEERLRLATELAGLGHWVWDAVEDRCIYCSEEHARIHGVTVDEYMAGTSGIEGELDFTHTENRETYRNNLRKLRGGEGFDIEYRVITPRGESRHVREIAKPVFDENGAVVQEYGTIQDITVTRLAEEALRESEGRFRSIVEYSPAAIHLKDLEGRYRLVNPNYERWYGVSAAEIVGKTCRDLFPEDDAESFAEQDRWVAETGEVFTCEMEMPFADGGLHTISMFKFPILGPDGQVIGLGGADLDVTDQRNAEEQLRQSQKLNAVGQLTGGLAHDFNNLLAIILGNAELLAEQLDGDDKPPQAIIRAATRGAELTQRLLAFSRQQPLLPKPVMLDAVVAQMTDLLRRTLGETIEIKTRSRSTLSPALADSGQVENALLNLALNARDAMPNGGRLTIETANATLGEAYAKKHAGVVAGDYVVLSVRDSGRGMAPEVLEHVFEPFFTTKGVGEGSGLGLSMVYGFAQQSGGHVSIDSKPGRGTRVRLYLPKADPVDEETGEAATKDDPRARGETVLVLEDDENVRKLAVTHLEDLGYVVLHARHGQEALGVLQKAARVDLLLSDVVLPGGMNGPELAERARQNDPALKVLFMSGYAETAFQSRDQFRGDAAMLKKPFRKRELAQRIRGALDGGAT